MFDIVKNKMIFFGIALLILVTGTISYFVQGFNLDIDFTGGVIVTYELGQEFDTTEAEAIAREAVGEYLSSVQATEGLGAKTAVYIKFAYESDLNTKDEREDFATDRITALTAALNEKYGEDKVEVLTQDDVSPSTGIELAKNAVLMASLAALAMLIYIAFRFEFVSGAAAVISLIYNIGVMFTVYTLFRVPVNTSLIAAILTVLGYCINDTIVIFDRIRENTRHAKKETYSSIVNKSIWQTMNRSINTVLTSVITILVLYILGVPSIKEFSFPIIIGMISGAYSSIFMASPLWATWKELGVKKK